jgi:putative phage-type endonuclease
MESAKEIVRATTIGSTDIARILGISPWGDAWSVYAEKKHLIEREPETERMFWGKRLQSTIADVWGERNNKAIEWHDKQIISAKYIWMSATPDSFVWTPSTMVRDGILEIKTVGLDQFSSWDRTTEEDWGVPDYYQAQAHWQMAVCDLPRCYIAPLFAGNELGSYVIERDAEIEEFFIEEGEKFWREHLMPGIEPPISGSEKARQYLQKKWPRERLKMRPPEPQELNWLNEYGSIRREQKELQGRRDTLENQLKQALGENAGFIWDLGKFTWKTSQRPKTDWKALAHRQMEGFHPEQIKAFIEEFTENKPSRRIYFKDIFNSGEDEDNESV